MLGSKKLAPPSISHDLSRSFHMATCSLYGPSFSGLLESLKPFDDRKVPNEAGKAGNTVSAARIGAKQS